MGLSGRKTKQKIGNDPRNLSWADDAARFGSNYLSKFGWDPSKGLGVGEEGRTSHIKVAQKLDMMGIGAAHQADPNGVAWKQNKDFENLLKRLNQANGDVEDGDAKEGSARIVVDGFVQQKGKLEEEREGEEGEEETVKAGREDDNKERKKKKKKRNEEQTKTKDKGKHKDEDNVEKKKKKRKREGNDPDKKSKKKRKSDNDSTSEDNNQDELSPTTPEPIPTTEHKVTRVVPRHRSHRARHIAAKSLSSKSAAAISEILGIAPTPSVASKSSGTQTPREGKLTSIYDDNDGDIEINKITTSTRSLQDYFKEKLGGLKEPTASTAAAADYDDIPRGGLGSRPKQAGWM